MVIMTAKPRTVTAKPRRARRFVMEWEEGGTIEERSSCGRPEDHSQDLDMFCHKPEDVSNVSVKYDRRLGTYTTLKSTDCATLGQIPRGVRNYGVPYWAVSR